MATKLILNGDPHCGRCGALVGGGSDVVLMTDDHYAAVYGPARVEEIHSDGIVMLCRVCGLQYDADRAAKRIQ